MRPDDSPVSEDARARHLPGPGVVWALGVALLHTAVVVAVPLVQATYGAFLPGGPGLTTPTPWTGEAAGVLLLVVVLSLGRWWRPAGLLRLEPTGTSGTSAARVLLPLVALAVGGAVVAAVQYDRAVPVGLDEGVPTAAAVGLAVVLSTVGSVLLVLGLVPLLLRGGDEAQRGAAYVVGATAAVIGLSRLAAVAVGLWFPRGMQPSRAVDFYVDPRDLAVNVAATVLLTLPLVAVAVRTGAPWLLVPVLLVQTLFLLPAGGWFWAYAALGAAYAAWLAATQVRGQAPSGTNPP